jgi:ferrous iron transport protein A
LRRPETGERLARPEIRRGQPILQCGAVAHIMRVIRICVWAMPVRLSELAMGATAVINEVEDANPNDPIARRLRELGFVRGEPIRLVAQGPLGGDPLLIQIGFTRFALRRAEAARVTLLPEGAA